MSWRDQDVSLNPYLIPGPVNTPSPHLAALAAFEVWPELSVECKVRGHGGCEWGRCECECHSEKPKVGDMVHILGTGDGVMVVAWRRGGFGDGSSTDA